MRLLVYHISTNDLTCHGFTPEQIEVLSFKDHNLVDFYKKQSKYYQRKSSRCLLFEKKKKAKAEVYRYTKRSSAKSVKPSLVKYQNLPVSLYFGIMMLLRPSNLLPFITQEVCGCPYVFSTSFRSYRP